MKNSNSHVYLYSKGWYKETNIISDLKVIYGKRNGLDPEDMQVRDIVLCISKLAYRYINNEYCFLEFLSDISPHSFRRTYYKETVYDFYVAVIEKCLSILSSTKITDIGELDDPDPNILPLK